MSVREAKDPNTPKERLATLSQSDDADIRAALTENPSTPLPLLFELAILYPAQFLRNPLLPLLLLEDPYFLHKAPSETVEVLALVPDPPEWLFSSISAHPSGGVRMGLAKDPRTPLPLLRLLAHDKEEFIRVLVPRNPSAPLALIESLAKDSRPKMRISVVFSPNVTEALLEALSRDEDEGVRLAVEERKRKQPAR